MDSNKVYRECGLGNKPQSHIYEHLHNIEGFTQPSNNQVMVLCMQENSKLPTEWFVHGG